MRARAFAKVNFMLAVHPPGRDGYHPLTSLAQSVGWFDDVSMVEAEEDQFSTLDWDDPPDISANLAWRALTVARSLADHARPVAMELRKRIPVAAGLGGGSADAAAALGLAGDLFRLDLDAMMKPASAIGSDVPFCLTGGTALIEGTGELLTALPPLDGFALGIVVPTLELATAEVYRVWDETAPDGDDFPTGGLPPPLRPLAPLFNDLEPAAFRVAPELADWKAELSREWGRPVAMTGSGPAMYGFFLDASEARAAVEAVSLPHRGKAAAGLVGRGWEKRGGGTLANPE